MLWTLKPRVTPAEDLPHQGKADELFTVLIFLKEPLEIVKEHPIKNRVFRMMLAVDPCHGRGDDSRDGPDCRRMPCIPDVPEMHTSAHFFKSVNEG